MVISPPPPRSTLFPYTKLFRSFSDTRYRSASKTFFGKTKRCCPPEGRTPVFNKIHDGVDWRRSEEHTSELQSRGHLVCRDQLEKKRHEQPEAKKRHQTNTATTR